MLVVIGVDSSSSFFRLSQCTILLILPDTLDEYGLLIHRWFRIGGSCQVADADNAVGAEAAAMEAIQGCGGGCCDV